MYSAVQSLSVSFGNVECSSVQISLARCSDCCVWYFPIQSRVVQCSAVCWSQAQTKTVQSSEVQCRPVQSSEVLSGSVQSSPVHSTNVRSSPFSEICACPVQFQFIPFQLSTFQSSIAQVHISQQQSSLIQSSAVQSSAIRSSSTPFRPVPSSLEQLTAVESSTTQSCSVKLGTAKCIAARPVKWSAIRKSPHLSPYKCISVQSCLQLTHQHNQERLLTALS